MRQLFTFLICSISSIAFTQFSIGIQTGVTINHFDFDGNLQSVDNLRSTYTKPFIGITPQYDINNKWAIRSGIYLYNRGVNIGTNTTVSVLDINIPLGLSSDFNTQHIDIPVFVKYNILSGSIGLYGIGGIGVSNIISAHIAPKATTLIDFNLPKIKISNDQINRLSTYGQIGIGTSVKVRSGKIFGEVQYQHSFESLNTSSIIDVDIKNKGFSVGIGYAMSF